LSRTSIKNVQNKIDGVGEDLGGKDQKVLARLIRLIKSEPESCIRHTILLQKSGLKAKDFEHYINTLIETKEVTIGTSGGSRGRKSVTYGV
jgi:hypothetical protein